MFYHEKDAQNVVTGWFFTKYGQNDIAQVKHHNDHEIFIGSSKHQ